MSYMYPSNMPNVIHIQPSIVDLCLVICRLAHQLVSLQSERDALHTSNTSLSHQLQSVTAELASTRVAMEAYREMEGTYTYIILYILRIIECMYV